MCFRTIFWNTLTFFALLERTSSTHVRNEGQNCDHINIGTAFLYLHILVIIKVCGSYIFFKISFYGHFFSSVTETYMWLVIHTIPNFITTLQTMHFVGVTFPVSHCFVTEWLHSEVIMFCSSVTILSLKWKTQFSILWWPWCPGCKICCG